MLIPTTRDPVAWLSALGVTDAPLTRAGVTTALRFFDTRMQTLPAAMRFKFLKGIDLHKPVRETTLAPPQVISAFRKSNEGPYRLFYTKAGTSVSLVGVNPAEREFRRFRVLKPVIALESRVCGARDVWSDASVPFIASGGGIQYIVPDSEDCLEVEQ